EESVGSHAPRVILFGAIPAIIPVIPEVTIVPSDFIVTPEVGAVPVVSPTGVLDLVDYLYSYPSEDSLPPALDLPLVLPFLCSDDSEADGESEPAEQRPVSSSHARFSRSGSYPGSFLPLQDRDQFPLAPVVAPPGIRRQPAILARPDEAIPFGRLYRTHLNGPRKLFVHRSLARTPRPSEAFRRWRSAPLSTHYPPSTSESSLGSSSKRSLDSSSPSSRPSCKRCRSPTALVPSPTHDSRSIAPTPIDLLPPCKRFIDLYLLKDSGEEHMEVDTADAEADADVGISEGVVAHTKDSIDMGVEIVASNVREDDEDSESSRGGIPDLVDTIYEIVHYMLEVYIDRITKIETTQRQLETSRMVASRERASLVERIGSLRVEYLKVRAMLSIERDRIDSIRWHMALSQEEFRQIRRDRDDTRRRLKRLESYVERHLGFRPSNRLLPVIM
ncbi:hypothetical protein Tco_1578150, partial [Tanacetum coccineum]